MRGMRHQPRARAASSSAGARRNRQVSIGRVAADQQVEPSAPADQRPARRHGRAEDAEPRDQQEVERNVQHRADQVHLAEPAMVPGHQQEIAGGAEQQRQRGAPRPGSASANSRPRTRPEQLQGPWPDQRQRQHRRRWWRSGRSRSWCRPSPGPGRAGARHEPRRGVAGRPSWRPRRRTRRTPPDGAPPGRCRLVPGPPICRACTASVS